MDKAQKVIKSHLLIILILTLLTSCGAKNDSADDAQTGNYEKLDDNYGNFYEIYVGSFYDSDSDGMGDINGIVQKLDYLNDGKSESDSSLHIDGMWLMPIMPSPSYHKYDVTDYYKIDPEYGTVEDFKKLLEECNDRGIKVIIDLVVNHTSNKHSWFTQALDELRNGSEPHYVDYYHFSDEKELTTYHSTGVEGYYYEGDFSNTMPDLNFDNENVRKEFEDIIRYWLEMGVAGFRLDAVKHVYPEQVKNIEFLQWLNDYCRSINPDVYIVGEVWSTDNEIIPYYESGINSLFNFSFAQLEGIIATAVNKNTGADFAKNVVRWSKLMRSRNPEAIDAIFLSNHDNDRSAGYYGDDLDKKKMAASLYLFMPGNPFIYYGEEIGLTGKGVDENKRGPMVWSTDDTTGIADGPKNMTERAKVTSGVAQQFEDEGSLLRFYINAIKLKNRFPEINRGTPSAIKTEDRAIAAYVLTYDERELAIVHNLSEDTKEVALGDRAVIKLEGYMTVGADAPTVSDGNLNMPPMSTSIVRLSE